MSHSISVAVMKLSRTWLGEVRKERGCQALVQRGGFAEEIGSEGQAKAYPVACGVSDAGVDYGEAGAGGNHSDRDLCGAPGGREPRFSEGDERRIAAVGLSSGHGTHVHNDHDDGKDGALLERGLMHGVQRVRVNVTLNIFETLPGDPHPRKSRMSRQTGR